MKRIITGLKLKSNALHLEREEVSVKDLERIPGTPLSESLRLIKELNAECFTWLLTSEVESLALLPQIKKMSGSHIFYVPSTFKKVKSYLTKNNTAFSEILIYSEHQKNENKHLERKKTIDAVEAFVQNHFCRSQGSQNCVVIVDQIPVVNPQTLKLNIEYKNYSRFFNVFKQLGLFGSPSFFLSSAEMIWSFILLPTIKNYTNRRSPVPADISSDFYRLQLLLESGFVFNEDYIKSHQQKVSGWDRRKSILGLVALGIGATITRHFLINNKRNDLNIGDVQRYLFHNNKKYIIAANKP